MDTAYIQREPYGVALVMGAWNYPIQITVVPLFGAIAAGNCVVLKPSELAGSTAKALEELIPKYLDNVSFILVSPPLPSPSPSPTSLKKEEMIKIFLQQTDLSMIAPLSFSLSTALVFEGLCEGCKWRDPRDHCPAEGEV